MVGLRRLCTSAGAGDKAHLATDSQRYLMPWAKIAGDAGAV